MKGKGVIIVGIIMLALFVVNYSEAVDAQLLTEQDTIEAAKKIKLFLKNNPFPDSAYNVEVDKMVAKAGILELKFKLVPRKEFFSPFQEVIKDTLGYINKKMGNIDKKEKLIRIKLLGETYRIPYKILESITNHLDKNIGNALTPTEKFSLIIRYELKNNSNRLIQVVDSVHSVAYGGGYKGYDEDGYEFYVIDFDNLSNINDSYFKDSMPIISDSVELPITSEKVKIVTAYIATVLKEREESALQQRKAEEEREKEKAAQKSRELAQKKMEEERKKQQLRAAEKKRANEEKRMAKKAERERLMLLCNNYILTQEDFILGKNPYADKGKCVEFSAATFQMTSANTGLFKIANNELVFIEFKETFRGPWVQGIAKIKGLYNYTTRGGISNQVPHLEMLEIEKILDR